MMEGDGEGGVTPADTHSRSQAVTRNHKAKKNKKRAKKKNKKE